MITLHATRFGAQRAEMRITVVNYVTMDATDLEVEATATVSSILESVSGANARWQVFNAWQRLHPEATFECCGVEDGAKLIVVDPMMLALPQLAKITPATLVWDEAGRARAFTSGVTFTVFMRPVAVETYFYECVQRSPVPVHVHAVSLRSAVFERACCVLMLSLEWKGSLSEGDLFVESPRCLIL